MTTYGDGSFSKLVMTGIKSKDYGKYHCVANNNAGAMASRTAFLFAETVGKGIVAHKISVFSVMINYTPSHQKCPFSHIT